MTRISFKKLEPSAKLPTQGKTGDAAYDLYSLEEVTLQPGETQAVRTGLQLAYMDPEQGDSKLHLEIKGRSGKALGGVYPIGGVIDATYRGEVKVILHNGNPQFQEATLLKGPQRTPSVTFLAGDRIAQFTVVKTAKDVEILESEDVEESTRGASGFGSTGR